MKKVLRNKYREIRRNIKDKDIKDKKIFNNLVNLDFINKYDTVLIYVSIPEEVDTLNLIKYFLKTKKVAVPKIINNEMRFCYISSLDDLEKGTFGIMEPVNNNYVDNYDSIFCIVPGICFSKDNYRIGYGGGYYDRFLDKNNVYSIGICYSDCLIDRIEVEPTDKKVDLIITD